MSSSRKKNAPRRPRTRYTLLRQWEMLRAIPKEPRMASFKDIADRMKEAGYPVDPNTVRRDLDELSGLFPLIIDTESRPHLCFWNKHADLGLPAMSPAETLAFRMVEQYLGQLLPTTVFDTIRGPFHRARKTLEALQEKNPTAAWFDKVRAVPPTQPMAPPHIDPAVYDILCHALLEGRQVKARYKPLGQLEGKEYLLHPLAMILRTPSLYLVATAWGYRKSEDMRLYALHRFEQAEMLDDPVSPPDGFDLDREIERGLADFGERGAPIEIELLVSEELAAILEETPLAVRGMPPKSVQTMTPEPDGRYRVKARVNDSWQLRWWILEQNMGIEVIAPAHLRDEIATQLGQAAATYGDQVGTGGAS